MKILIFSPNYIPLVGGLETTVDEIASSLSKNGYTIKLATHTPAEKELERSFEIIRNPSPLQLLKLFKWSDGIYFPNLSLKGFWPQLFFWKPLFISNHVTHYKRDGSIDLTEKVKIKIMRKAHVACCSEFVLKKINVKGEVIHSPYDHRLFRRIPEIEKTRDLVFLGRLVSDKGCDLIIKALEILGKDNFFPNLTIIGKGKEKENLISQIKEKKLESQVTFTGVLTGEALVKELNRYRILVAPSIWAEPFGKVALEGLACGCDVIVPAHGGFPESAGSSGIFFNPTDYNDLAVKIKATLLHPPQKDQKAIEQHLLLNNADTVGKKYVAWFSKYLKPREAS